MSNKFKEELSRMETGSVALVYSDPSSDLTVEVLNIHVRLSGNLVMFMIVDMIVDDCWTCII